MSYKVPIDFLKSAASDPNWTEETTPVKQLKYVDEDGTDLAVPTTETHTVSKYVSKVNPAVWAWIPKQCQSNSTVTGDSNNPVVCAAGAAGKPNADATTAPANLELVKIAEADSFVRSVCSLCWPNPETLSAVWTNPDVARDIGPKTADPQAAIDKLKQDLLEAKEGDKAAIQTALTTAMDALAADRLKHHQALASEPNSAIMQGQHGYLAVTSVNESQTPGYWRDLKIIVTGVPVGATITPDRAIQLPSDGSRKKWPDNPMPDSPPINPRPINCTLDTADSTKWVCTVTGDAAALKAIDLPELFDQGTYSFLFRVVPGLETPVTKDGSAPYELKINTTYPHYKEGEAAFGITGTDSVETDFTVIPEAEAVIGLTAYQKNPTYSKDDPATNIWNPYSGDPIDIALKNLNETDSTALAKQSVDLRYEVTNQGPRWIRPGDKIRLDVDLPPGVNPGVNPGVGATKRTNFDFDHEASTEVRDFGETWVCPPGDWIPTKEKSGNDYGFEFTWTIYSVMCEAIVSDKRGTDGFIAPDQANSVAHVQHRDATGPHSLFPALVLQLSGDIQSPSDRDNSVAQAEVWRKTGAAWKRISAEVPIGTTAKPKSKAANPVIIGTPAANPNAVTSVVPIDVVDPNSTSPTVQPYWLVRPVAGGHASARVDVANINRGAAADMNLLLDFSLGSSFVSGKGDAWTCKAMEDEKRATCRYAGGLKPHNGPPTELNGTLRYDRTAPLLVVAKIASNALDLSDEQGNKNTTFRMSVKADVLNIKSTAPMGSDGGGLSYPIGRPIKPDAKTLATDAISTTAKLPEPAAPGAPVGFDPTIDIAKPGTDQATLQLDAKDSVGPFAGQPINVAWQQVCVIDQESTWVGHACGEKKAPAVVLKPSVNVLNPTFSAPTVKAETTFKFKLTVSDPVEKTDTANVLPPIVGSSLGLVEANAASKDVDVVIAPPIEVAPTGVGRRAGADNEPPSKAAPGGPVIADVKSGDTTLTVRVAPSFDDGGSPVTGYEYSTDKGATWAKADPAPLAAPTAGATVSPSEEAVIKDTFIIATESKPPGDPATAPNRSPLVNGTSYDLQLRAVNEIGSGEASQTASATPQAPQAPPPPPTEPTPTSPPPTEPSPPPSPSAPPPTDRPPGVSNALPAVCATAQKSAIDAGFVFTFTDPQPTEEDAGVCEVTGGSVKYNDWLTLVEIKATLAPDSVTIKKGTAKDLPANWSFLPGDPPLTVTTQITFPIGVGSGATAGTLSTEALPFHIGTVLVALGLETLADLLSTGITFKKATTGKVPEADFLIKGGGDPEGSPMISVTGLVETKGKFSLKVVMNNIIKIAEGPPPTLTPVFLNLAGSIDYTPAPNKRSKSKLGWSVSGEITKLPLSSASYNPVKGQTGDVVVMLENLTITISVKDVDLSSMIVGAKGIVTLTKNSKTLELDIDGSFSEGTLHVSGEAKGLNWPSVFKNSKVNLLGSITYTRGEGVTGLEMDFTVTAVGTEEFSKGLVRLTNPTLTLAGNTAKGTFAGSASATIGIRGVSGWNDPPITNGDPLIMDAEGSVTWLKDEGAVLTLNAKQSPVATGAAGFEITSGVFINGIDLKLSYDTGSTVKKTNPKFSASFKGGAQVRVPNKTDMFTSLDIDAKYNDPEANPSVEGLFFEVNASGLQWKIADGVQLSDLGFAYSSYKMNYPSKIKAGDGTLLLPTFKDFQGFVALGAVTKVEDNEFLYNTLKFGGSKNDLKIGAYIKVDNVAVAYEAAVLSKGAIPVFGEPTGNESSLSITDPYLKVTYLSQPAASLTVALGGGGSLRYPDSSTGTKEMKKFEGLNVGASVDITKGLFAAKISVGTWKNAGGITGLTINNATIDVGLTNVIQGTESVKTMTASFAAQMTADDSSGGEAPGFLTAMGIVNGTVISVGFAMSENWCAKLSIGDDSGTKVALQPFKFAGETMKKILEINYANFVYVSSVKGCAIGGETLTKTGMVLKGSFMKIIPINLNLGATSVGTKGDDIQLDSPLQKKPDGTQIMVTDPATGLPVASRGNPVTATQMGPATLDNAMVDVSLDTTKKASETVPDNPVGATVGVAGNMPVGDRKISVSGGIEQKDKKLKISLAANMQGEANPITFGKFSLYNAKVDVLLLVDPEAKPVISPKDFRMKIVADAKLLDARFETSLALEYAGGNVQSMAGSISAKDGVAIGSMLIVGKGALDWSTTAGLAVTIGSATVAADKASFSYCVEGATKAVAAVPAGGGVPAVAAVPAACTNKNAYAFTDAYLDFNPKGFAIIGTLTIGKTFTGQLTGSYYHEDAQGKKITLNGKELLDSAKAGDFSFGLDDATLTLPSGQTTASLGLARFGGNASPTFYAKMAFAIPMLGGKISFDGDYATSGRYAISAEVKKGEGLSVGGFTLESGLIWVRNYVEVEPKVFKDIQTTIDIEVEASLATWGKAMFAGKFGWEDKVIGYRLKGSMKVTIIKKVEATVAVSYSNFPKDAGFGFFTEVQLPGNMSVAVGGVFRKISLSGSEIMLYRGSGGISMPIVPGVAAQGTATMDNCINDASTACAKPRNGSKATPQIRVAAGVAIGGGLANAAVEGIIGFDGAFRMIGSAKAGVSMGPWGFFGIITAEAGFSMSFGVCFANAIAVNRPDEGGVSSKVGCGRDLNLTWVVGVDGKAWAGVKMNLGLFKFGISVKAELAGVIWPSHAKFCAVFGAFGFDITFGTCPEIGEIPEANPTLHVNEFV